MFKPLISCLALAALSMQMVDAQQIYLSPSGNDANSGTQASPVYSLAAARDLIRKGGRKISEICFDVGFRNLSHFSKLYKTTYGVAPSREIIPDPQPLPEP